MKVETKPKTTVTTTYTCEGCGKSSQWRDTIEQCEVTHKCKHIPSYKFMEACEDNYWFQVKGIKEVCQLCKKVTGEVDFEDEEDNQDLLARIFTNLKEKT